jgi:mono/diheme cytochrome c family protein
MWQERWHSVFAGSRRRWILWGGLALVGALAAAVPALQRQPVDYQAEVKPILNRHCLSCHGGVRKKAGFSLLFEEEALAPTASGRPAIVPGDAAHSEMIRRLRLHDPEERMPYRKAPLSDDEIAVLERWVDEGARFGTHWAYRPLAAPVEPRRGWRAWLERKAAQEIDRHIDARLDAIGLARSPEADAATLARRVALDLIGMPASEALTAAYVRQPDAKGYERLVDSLLASPRFGERWAAVWMDLARYADSKGYEADQPRSIWRYRDWLIKAFNADMPYDRFLTEQLAGDMLPDPGDEQFIATAFHRNTLTNDEGGSDNEEFRISAVMDRVNTTWEAVMGTSFACVQCHSHPYDPFRQEEYYRFMAYFNNARDEDTNMDYPVLREFRGASRRQYDSLTRWIAGLSDAPTAAWFDRFLRTCGDAVNTLKADSLQNAAISSSWYLMLRRSSWGRLRGLGFDGKGSLLLRYRCQNEGGTLSLHLDSAGGRLLARLWLKNEIDGWNLHELALPADLSGSHDLHLHYENPGLRSLDDNGILFDWVAPTPALPGRGLPDHAGYRRMYLDLLNRPDAELTPVVTENPGYLRRTTQVFERGDWRSPGRAVEPGIPAVIASATGPAGRDRRALAAWVTDPRHPLTARVLVNRLWEQLFGTGLVESLEDFGTQGIPPTHPELLDMLAWRFLHDDAWSVKKALKRIVLSETYRQRSEARPEGMAKDPRNRYHWRAPRVRLSAEQVRDQALQVSGLLSGKMYGPSVMPYQPDGIWASPYNGMLWRLSEGEDRYRRALYTFWKRSSPYPSLMNFDGVSREVCTSRRIRTNTPLQALTLLNDSTYWDASVRLALRADSLEKGRPRERIAQLYRRVAGREPAPEKVEVLEHLYRSSYERLGRRPEEVERLLAGHACEPPARRGLAALAITANAILNLDEVVTRN